MDWQKSMESNDDDFDADKKNISLCGINLRPLSVINHFYFIEIIR